MSSWNDGLWTGVARRLLLLAPLLILPAEALPAQEFGASTLGKGQYMLRVFPKAFYTSAYFSGEGKALNLETVTGLLHVEVPVQLQYGVTGSLMVGAILPVEWTYQEILPELREDPVHRLAVRDLWLTVQHRWWALPFVSSSSLRVKLPLADKKEWEGGLRTGDGQIDVFPVYYFDYASVDRYWFTKLILGYKYRFENGGIKPFDELSLRSTLGFELWGAPKMDVFLFADLTRFRNGDYGETDQEFFQKEGSLHTFGYGVSVDLDSFSTKQIYMETAGDFSGRNRYRGMRWTVGLRHVFNQR